MDKIAVTPFAGVWIEIMYLGWNEKENIVTPFAGVWIEIKRKSALGSREAPSLPSRECGLKYLCKAMRIEIIGHSLRGSVD